MPIEFKELKIEVPESAFKEEHTVRLRRYLTDGGTEEGRAKALVEELLSEGAMTVGDAYLKQMGSFLRQIEAVRNELRAHTTELLTALRKGTPTDKLPARLSADAFGQIFRSLEITLEKLKPPEELPAAVHKPLIKSAGLDEAMGTAAEGEPPPTQPAAPAPTAPPDVVRTASERLRERKLQNLAEELDDLPPGTVKRRFAAQLANMSDKELNGLEELWRLDPQRVDPADALATLNGWGTQTRGEFLELLAEVGPRFDNESLEAILHSIFQRTVGDPGTEVLGVAGSYGQLYAALTAVRELGAVRLEAEVVGAGRTIDLVAHTAAGERISIEVKTNLETSGGVNRGEAGWDIVHHAGEKYQDLRYMYHPRITEAERAALGRRMLRLFDEPDVQAALTQDGHDVAAAREAFQAWLKAGGLGTYSLP
jgi:hypothetical protein